MLLGRRAECEVLDRALSDARAGQSRVIVVRGEPGAGKTALLNYLSQRVDGWRVATATGVESEMELAYSGLHQLCAPMLNRLDRLPIPQRDALATVFGRESGPVPDRFLVGLAALTLFADVSEEQPLVCVVDDAHWLDAASAQILGFVARRLLAERVALVLGARTGAGDEALSGLPELVVSPLADGDARKLLLENVHGPLDAAVCEQIITESHGNPLALLELPRTWNSAELAGGFGIPASPVAGKIEQSYARRLQLLPFDSQLFVLIAAAEPLGDPVLLHGAAKTLGIDPGAVDPARDAGLLEVGARVRFAHPLVRSASYRSAAGVDRHRVHRALAEATDADRDPDRRAWHLAGAAPGPDERTALELEQSAGRAQARGGLAAAAAFLERAALLSPDPRKRARRALDAAAAKQLAGSPDAASALLTTAVRESLDERESAMAQRLQGQIALDLRRGGDAVPFLLDAAARLADVEPRIARETYLEALRAGSIGGRLSEEMLERATAAIRDVPEPGGSSSAVDLLLAGLAVRFTDGYAASAPSLKRALAALCDESREPDLDVRWPGFARRVAPDLFDDEAWHIMATRSVQLARDKGALGVLPVAVNNLATLRCFEGDLEAAAALLEESDAIADATSTARIAFARLTLAAFRGDETKVLELVEIGDAAAHERGEGVLITFGEHARALLYNGLGRYDAALSSAESASARDELCVSQWSLPELVEAATRAGRKEIAEDALARLTERTQAAGTEWALGIEARSRALFNEDTSAEDLYREALERLAGSRVTSEQARAHLLYGEWLRRAGRRVDAREQLHAAHDLLATIGMEAFAERARRELLATGEKARKRTAETRGDLTAQEAQIAELAREGRSNPEIGAQLFLSPRTVEWHLRKVFGKLGISSRKELDAALRTRVREAQPV